MARFSNPFIQILNGNGNPLPGAKLFFYEPGTTTLKDTYSDSGISIANTNPVIADGSGRFGDIFLSGIYKAALKDADDVTVDTVDPVGGVNDGAFSLWVNDNAYNIPDIVVGPDNLFYKSKTDSNQGNNPVSSPANWEAIYFSSTADSTILKDADIGTTVQAYDADLDALAANNGSNLTGVIAGLGVGQTWQDVKASRALSTTYTNSTGRTILVSIAISTTLPGGTGATFYVDGVQVLIHSSASAANYIVNVYGVVPTGSTYSITGTNSPTISIWMELR